MSESSSKVKSERNPKDQGFSRILPCKLLGLESTKLGSNQVTYREKGEKLDGLPNNHVEYNTLLSSPSSGAAFVLN